MAGKGVCLYFSIWIIWEVKISEGIVDTCPSTEITPSTRVAKMCQTTTAMEDDKDGNNNFDSVFLSLTKKQNNCSCYLSVKNLTSLSYSLYIKQFNYFRQQPLCGMEIDIDQHRRTLEIVPFPDPIPSRCNSAGEQIFVSLFKDETLQFTSREVDGNFSMGYCIQIIRVHTQGGTDDSFLAISCGMQAITTPKATYTTANPWATLNDVTTSGHLTSILSSPTSMIDKSHINDKTDSEGDSTLYIAVGTSGGFIVCVSMLVVFLLCKRRKLHSSAKEETSANCKATTASDDDDDDGLKYNVLYASSERHDDIDVNYSTADGDILRHTSGDDEGGYSTVDDNKTFQNSNLGTYQVMDAALEINVMKHINAPTESGCVYAVVDKTNKTNTSVYKVETGATYAVVNKNRMSHSNEGDE